MVERKLKETEGGTPYLLRHSCEESMLEAGVDHRLRVELMGHDYNRPKYGEGGSLELKHEAIGRVCFFSKIEIVALVERKGYEAIPIFLKYCSARSFGKFPQFKDSIKSLGVLMIRPMPKLSRLG